MIPKECEKCIHCRVCAYNNPKKKRHCDFYEESISQGEWIEKVETKQLGHGWLTTHETVCSVCGGSGENDEGIPQCWKFCPNCGADMRKGGAEE